MTAERLSLGTRTADKKRRAEIDEELQVIRGNSEALRFCLDMETDLRAHQETLQLRERTTFRAPQGLPGCFKPGVEASLSLVKAPLIPKP